MSSERQPYLHHHVSCVQAPATWLSPPDGQVRGGVDGLYVADRRALSRLEVRVDGEEPVAVRGAEDAADEARFLGVLPWLGDDGPDPTVWCERARRVRPDGGTETVRVHNAARAPVVATVEVTAAADLVSVSLVKSGRAAEPTPAALDAGGLAWSAADGMTVTLRATPRPHDTVKTTGPEGTAATLRWRLTLPAGGTWEAELDVTCTPPWTDGFRPLAPTGPPAWRDAPLRVDADDVRLARLVERGVADLAALRLADPLEPADDYPAGGSPWYLTLFARDALWATRLALPLGPEVAAATLRTLARRQGTKLDPRTEEAPGKIPHELRPAHATVWHAPVYYGTVDATPLFVVALAEAWRWGLDPERVAELLPAAERACEWMVTHGDPDGDGFVKYLPDGDGLVNQGWKDSHDGIQHADGRLATPPIALAEVQAYAHQAARSCADLLDAFARPGAKRWRDWADALAERFRAVFWLSDAVGRYPAIALEAGKNPVDGPASNMGHLLDCGMLNPEEEHAVAVRLAAADLDSGHGLRTLSSSAAGFNPLGYHAGSVWPHDTAITALGLARTSHQVAHQAAASLIAGVVAAAPAFAYRLPELYGGERAGSLPPLPYPAACRPQAWAAAAGPAFVQALLGLDPDVPGGTVRLRPLTPSPVGACAVRNVRLGDAGTLDIRIDAQGTVVEVRAPAGIRVEVG